jgi:hypothetical protein
MLLRRLAIASLVFLLIGCAGTRVTKDKVADLQVGMTEMQVVERIGKPNDINRSQGQGYERAQFVYHIGQYDRAYVYFENRRLSSVQY